MKKDNLFKFVLLTFWGCLCFSCQNEEYEETFDEESQISIREISKTEIPVGITPMAFNNRAELDEFIKSVENLHPVQNSTPTKSTRVAIKRTKSYQESDDIGIKDKTSELMDGYTIIIHLAYNRGEDDVTVTSENYGTWFLSSWTQTSGVASWKDENTIEYSIRGDIKWYALVKNSYFEIRKVNFKDDGYVDVD